VAGACCWPLTLSSATVMEEQSYTSTHPLGHTRPVTGSLYLFTFYNLIFDFMQYQLHIISLYHRRIFIDGTYNIQFNMSV